MSTQRGNANKSGPPKYKNRTAFRNDLHDSSKQTKIINRLDAAGLCQRCKSIIDWKIKYKKYKPLTQLKKCVKCGEKAVKNSYYTICAGCTEREKICGKCGQKEDSVQGTVNDKLPVTTAETENFSEHGISSDDDSET